MKIDVLLVAAVGVLLFIIGMAVGKRYRSEPFEDYESLCPKCGIQKPCDCASPCGDCGHEIPCGCKKPSPAYPVCPSCPEPDASKWVLKATVPPCPPLPDMSKYMLKTECPPQPDMSKYTLKSSVPKCPPCISTCAKPCKIGECPPCPRPRCPVVQCPEPKACPACPAAMCAPCPEPDIKCNATYKPSPPVRPMLASTSTFGF